MLRIFITLIIYALGFVGLAQTPQNKDEKNGEKNMHQIDVVINDIMTDNGKVYFGLYDSEMNLMQENHERSKYLKFTKGLPKFPSST